MDNLVHAKQATMNRNALLNRKVFIQLSDSSEKSYYPDVAVFIYIPGDTL
jgi:hypothetical protein